MITWRSSPTAEIEAAELSETLILKSVQMFNLTDIVFLYNGKESDLACGQGY